MLFRSLEHGGVCHLRFDDTNPSTESVEYAEAIQADVRWLGFDWGDRMFYASGYFEQLYEYAVELIQKGMAYVDSLSAEEIRLGQRAPVLPDLLGAQAVHVGLPLRDQLHGVLVELLEIARGVKHPIADRKSTRLNSSH